MNERTKNIYEVLNKFSGNDGEPKNDIEKYILKSMWIMMLSEFEGFIKELVENHIDKIKNHKIENIHACILLTHFEPTNKSSSSVEKLIEAYGKEPKNINYKKFTKDNTPKYKKKPVVKLFNSLGTIFSLDELTELTKLDSMGSTRDSIAHGDKNIQITATELKNNIDDLTKIASILAKKIK